MRKEAYIFDLDGTLCDIRHRLHYINKEKPDWQSFNLACAEDILNLDLEPIIQALNMEYTIIIVTGRMDINNTIGLTISWLDAYNIPHDHLFYRKNQDYRSDDIVKKEIYEINIQPNFNVLAVFDDRDRVVKMWRNLGLRCYQVQPGDY